MLNYTDNALLGAFNDKSDQPGQVDFPNGLPERRPSINQEGPAASVPPKYLTPNMDALKRAIDQDSPQALQ